MKEIFLELVYRIRMFVYRNNDYLLLAGGITWLVVAFIIGYNLWGMIYNSDMPNEEKYYAYETIVQQILDGQIEDVILPENTEIKIHQGEIKVKNTRSYYSVTSSVTQEKAIPIKEDNSHIRFVGKLIGGGLLLGLFFIGFVCPYIIYLIFAFLFTVSNWIHDIIKHRRRVRRFEEDKRAKLEKSESEHNCE